MQPRHQRRHRVPELPDLPAERLKPVPKTAESRHADTGELDAIRGALHAGAERSELTAELRHPLSGAVDGGTHHVHRAHRGHAATHVATHATTHVAAHVTPAHVTAAHE